MEFGYLPHNVLVVMYLLRLLLLLLSDRFSIPLKLLLLLSDNSFEGCYWFLIVWHLTEVAAPRVILPLTAGSNQTFLYIYCQTGFNQLKNRLFWKLCNGFWLVGKYFCFFIFCMLFPVVDAWSQLRFRFILAI